MATSINHLEPLLGVRERAARRAVGASIVRSAPCSHRRADPSYAARETRIRWPAHSAQDASARPSHAPRYHPYRVSAAGSAPGSWSVGDEFELELVSYRDAGAADRGDRRL